MKRTTSLTVDQATINDPYQESTRRWDCQEGKAGIEAIAALDRRRQPPRRIREVGAGGV